MGTEVQSKMYFPGDHFLSDLSENSRNGVEAQNYENRTLQTEQYGSLFSMHSLTGDYMGYCKEQVRQTLINQESTFRHQVHELHRLYNRQREMMNEVRIKELDSYRLPSGSSQRSSLIPFSFLSEGESLRRQVPTLPCHKPSPSGGNGIQAHFNSVKDIAVRSYERGGLHLYSGVESCSDGDALSSNVLLRSTRGIMTNLKDPFQFEEAPRSASVNILSNTTSSKENSSRFQHLSTEFSQDQCKRNSYQSNIYSEADEQQSGRSAHKLEAGQVISKGSYFGGSLCLVNSSTPPQVELRKAQEYPNFLNRDQNNTEVSRKRKLFGVDISESFCNSSSSNHQVQGNPVSNVFTLSCLNAKTSMPSPTAVRDKFHIDSSCGSVPDLSVDFSYENAVTPSVYQMNLDFLQNQDEIRKRASQSNVHDAVSTTHTNIVGDSNSMTICSIKVGLVNTDLNHEPILPNFEEIPSTRSLNHQIDLNLCPREEDEELIAYSPRANTSIAVENDLVTPVINEHGLESIKTRPEETLISSGDESADPLEGVARDAAQTLVVISQMPIQVGPDLSYDSLSWFAGISCSLKGDTEDESGTRLDYFELMTLNLAETKMSECNYETKDLKSSLPEEKTPTLQLQSCRGQARRRGGRQRKDFQRDVLPSLTSLSRNEVTEDLRMFEGMVRTVGGTWQSTLSSRSNSVSGRGSRRSANPTETQQEKCGEVVGRLEEIRLTGWGKRTRRLPRQQCPINN